MIQHRTMLKVADNTGATRVQCISLPGGTGIRYGRLGSIVKISVKEAKPHSSVKKGEVYDAVLVRATKETKRKDGTYVRFDENAVVIIDKKNNEPKGTRIFGPVARELRDAGFSKIVSLAPEVL